MQNFLLILCPNIKAQILKIPIEVPHLYSGVLYHLQEMQSTESYDYLSNIIPIMPQNLIAVCPKRDACGMIHKTHSVWDIWSTYFTPQLVMCGLSFWWLGLSKCWGRVKAMSDGLAWAQPGPELWPAGDKYIINRIYYAHGNSISYNLNWV
jgi:hypothetical protein